MADATIFILFLFEKKKIVMRCCFLLWWWCCEEGDGDNLFLPFFLLWSFWSSSLELKINNEMVVFLKMLKVVMARGRRLKKGGGDLEVQKQNVASLKSIIRKQNVDPL